MAAPDTVSINPAVDGQRAALVSATVDTGYILPYPGNLSQLMTSAFTNASDFQALSEADSLLIGSSGTATTSVTWTSGGTSGTTTSTEHNFFSR